MLIYPILSALVIMFASLSGVIFVWQKAGGVVERNSHYLTSLAMGVFMMTVITLIVEAWELLDSFILVTVWVLIGGLFLELAIRLIPKAHHHHGTESKDCKVQSHSKIDGRRMLLGDAIHNLSDGILLVPAFLINVWLGAATAFGILLHELAQELAEFFVLKEAGYSTKRALSLNFLVSATILIGLGLGFLIADYNLLIGPLIALSAGGFWYVIIRDLLPDITEHITTKKSGLIHLIIVLLGISIMLGVSLIVPHSHAKEDNNHYLNHTN